MADFPVKYPGGWCFTFLVTLVSQVCMPLTLGNVAALINP